MSYHTIIIVGRLGKDPELKYTASGQPVTTFSMASDRQLNGKDGQAPVKETLWFRVTAWGSLAETCNQYLEKGKMVLVEGRLTADEHGNPRIWTRQGGEPSASFEVTASTVRFLSGKNGAGSDPGELQTKQALTAPPVGDDIPF